MVWYKVKVERHGDIAQVNGGGYWDLIVFKEGVEWAG